MAVADAPRAGPGARRAPAGLPGRRPGELVPGPGHGALQRGGHRRRPLRARELPGVPAAPAPVDDADHRVRRPPGRRPRRRRLARLGQGDAAQLDRPLAGRVGAVRGPAGSDEAIEVFTTRPDTLFGATYLVLAPEHPLVDAIVPSAWPAAADRRAAGRPLDRRCRDPRRRDRRVPQRRRLPLRPGAPGGARQDRRLHRRLGGQPGQRRVAAGLRRRLRADGLRHRRDHGRPRPGPA